MLFDLLLFRRVSRFVHVLLCCFSMSPSEPAKQEKHKIFYRSTVREREKINDGWCVLEFELVIKVDLFKMLFH